MQIKNIRGFTFVEIIIVVAILAVAAIMMVSTINPKTISDKGFDARRKKDLDRIRLAFEEYFNDKDCYPTENIANNLDCSSADFKPWLSTWPCDPDGSPYKFRMDGDPNCPNSFKIFTNLHNKKDGDIPSGWYSQPAGTTYGNGWTPEEVNFGVSSTNVRWNEN